MDKDRIIVTLLTVVSVIEDQLSRPLEELSYDEVEDMLSTVKLLCQQTLDTCERAGYLPLEAD